MDKDKFEEITEQGVKKLGLGWPVPETMYELRIPRIGIEQMRKGQTKPRIFHLYFDFLYLDVFPLIDKLEQEADIQYWHILNHGEFTDLRMAIENDDQMVKVNKMLKENSFPEDSLTELNTYKDPSLGSRLGCQALMRLYHAQSRFVRDIIKATYWINTKSDLTNEEKLFLTNNLIDRVPIYTSHMLLNIFPGDSYYEVASHINEAYGRLESIVNALPEGAKDALQHLKDAAITLSKSMERP